MEILHSLVVIQGIALLSMGVTYVLSIRRTDLGWVDVGWAAGLAFAALVSPLLTSGAPWREGLVALMVAAWAFRLAAFIVKRLRSGEEDARYQALRRHWGRRTNLYAFCLFTGETFLITLFSLPVVIVMSKPDPAWTGWDALGVGIWLVSLIGEATADRQLARFRSYPENRARTCREGLWRYSRHPNYFFEWTHWFAYAAMAVGAPNGVWAWAGPILMFVFLFKVTGIPFAEKQALARRGDDYRSYQQSTSILIPWFPRSEES